MYYPGNYGFIPHTLSGDGDPVDVLVIGRTRGHARAAYLARASPLASLLMEDDAGEDEKIIAVPHAKLYPYHDNIDDLEAVQPILRDKISHFFTHYKDLEPRINGRKSKVGEMPMTPPALFKRA
jgi:inorganic pyrophosphatase